MNEPTPLAHRRAEGQPWPGHRQPGLAGRIHHRRGHSGRRQPATAPPSWPTAALSRQNRRTDAAISPPQTRRPGRAGHHRQTIITGNEDDLQKRTPQQNPVYPDPRPPEIRRHRAQPVAGLRHRPADLPTAAACSNRPARTSCSSSMATPPPCRPCRPMCCPASRPTRLPRCKQRCRLSGRERRPDRRAGRRHHRPPAGGSRRGGHHGQRREIQFAADAEWPHTDPANAGIRVEFQLPVDRVMK